MKKINIIIFYIIILVSISGCQDRAELEEQAYVVVIGMDYFDEDSILVTYQIANPQGGGGNAVGKTSQEPASEVITLVAPDIISGRDTAGAFITRRLTFSHAKTLIVGEELAKHEMFFRHIESALRDRQIRRNTFFVITKEPAHDFIETNSPTLETRPHKYYELMSRRWSETGFVAISKIHNFVRRTEGDASLYLAIYGTTKTMHDRKSTGYEDEYLPGEIFRLSGDPGEMIGSAVFKEGVMIGILNGEETRLSLILREDKKIDSMLATFIDPLDKDYRLTLRAKKQEKTKVAINVDTPNPIINVIIPIKMELLSIHSMIDYATNVKNRKILEEYLEAKLVEKTKALIQKTQKEFEAEPFQWGLEVREKFSTLKEYINYNWMQSYTNATVNIKYDIEIIGFGKQLSPPDYEKVKD